MLEVPDQGDDKLEMWQGQFPENTEIFPFSCHFHWQRQGITEATDWKDSKELLVAAVIFT